MVFFAATSKMFFSQRSCLFACVLDTPFVGQKDAFVLWPDIEDLKNSSLKGGDSSEAFGYEAAVSRFL